MRISERRIAWFWSPGTADDVPLRPQEPEFRGSLHAPKRTGPRGIAGWLLALNRIPPAVRGSLTALAFLGLTSTVDPAAAAPKIEMPYAEQVNIAAAPTDILRTESRLVLDPEANTIKGELAVDFVLGADGRPRVPIPDQSFVIDVDGRPVIGQPHRVWSDDDEWMPAIALPAGRHRIRFGFERTIRDSNDWFFTKEAFEFALDQNRGDPELVPAQRWDRSAAVIEVEVTDGRPLTVVTSGKHTSRARGHHRIEWPDHSNTAGRLLRISNETPAREILGRFESIDGRRLPLSIAEPLERDRPKIVAALAQLEADLGPIPSSQIRIATFGTGTGVVGMSEFRPELLARLWLTSLVSGGPGDDWILKGLEAWFASDRPRDDSPYQRASMRMLRDPGGMGDSHFFPIIDGVFASEGGLTPVLRALIEGSDSITSGGLVDLLRERVPAKQREQLEEILRWHDLAPQKPHVREQRSGDLSLAPPDAVIDGATITSIDIQRVDAEITLRDQLEGRATVEFVQDKRGKPIVELRGDVIRAELEGVGEVALRRARIPGAQGASTFIDRELEPGTHRLRIEYRHAEPRFERDGDSYRFTWSMGDMGERTQYSEAFVPSSGEFDQYELTVRLRLEGTERRHRLLANGIVEETADGFNVRFPPSYTTSSPYLTLFDPEKLVVHEAVYHGVAKPIPIRVVAENLEEAKQVEGWVKDAIAFAEQHIGPYPHAAFLADVHAPKHMGAGMEYAGATEAGPSEQIVRHEVFHSWFARGVMPASGLSGWIDEGIVYWMASNFAPLDRYEANAKLPRIFESLSASNAHEPGVGDMAYRLAVTFIRHLDHALAEDGGLRPLLRSFFAEYQHKVVDTHVFWSHLRENIPPAHRDRIDRLFEQAGFQRVN